MHSQFTVLSAGADDVSSLRQLYLLLLLWTGYYCQNIKVQRKNLIVFSRNSSTANLTVPFPRLYKTEKDKETVKPSPPHGLVAFIYHLSIFVLRCHNKIIDIVFGHIIVHFITIYFYARLDVEVQSKLVIS